MNLPLSGRVRLTALVAVAVGLAAGGVAYASIPDGSGVIHGCRKTVGGALRVIDSSVSACNAGETQLNWNQKGSTGGRGPTGDKGTTGTTGPTGPSGATGSSNAYTDYEPNVTIQQEDTVTVASVTLPIGSYALSGSVDVFPTDSGDSDPTLVQCEFLSAGALNGHIAIASVEGDIGDTMPIIGDVTITTTNTSVFLRCEALTNPAQVYRPELIATQVGTITPSQ